MSDTLLGRRALICGASRGIGRATAIKLASQGAQLVLCARDGEALAELQNEIEEIESIPKPEILVVDLKNSDELENQLKKTVTVQNPVHILVCNAGGPKGGPLIDAAPQEFLDAFRVHVIANQILAKACVPGMIQSGYGRIINIISTSVKIPIPNLGVSNTIRGAVASWSKTLANELGPQGITVNNILPGFTETERLGALKSAASSRLQKSTEQIEELWKSQVPLRRFAKPEETAEAIAFLASPSASYISGQNLAVDGGRLGCL